MIDMASIQSLSIITRAPLKLPILSSVAFRWLFTVSKLTKVLISQIIVMEFDLLIMMVTFQIVFHWLKSDFMAASTEGRTEEETKMIAKATRWSMNILFFMMIWLLLPPDTILSHIFISQWSYHRAEIYGTTRMLNSS